MIYSKKRVADLFDRLRIKLRKPVIILDMIRDGLYKDDCRDYTEAEISMLDADVVIIDDL